MPRSIVVPESLKACENGWENLTKHDCQHVFVDELRYSDKILCAHFRDTYITMADRMGDEPTSRGDHVTSVNVFRYLLHPAIDTILDHIRQELVNKGLVSISTAEMWNFIGTMMFRTTFNVGTGPAWEIMAKAADDFELMDSKQFHYLLRCLRGYNVRGRSQKLSDSVSLRQSKMLRPLNFLEIRMFEGSILTLINTKNGVLALDDEPIAFKAIDVAMKTLSQRKSGKEAPVADWVCCAVTNMHFGFRLWVRGEP